MDIFTLKRSVTGTLLLIAFQFCLKSSAQTYAPLPFSESFEKVWVNKDGTRDVPSLYWKNTPATGNNSWRRHDDGVSANWMGVWPSVDYSPWGARNTSYSARFHSLWYELSGTLDLSVDFSTQTGNKSLSFWYINPNGTDKLEIFLSTDGGTTFGAVLWTKTSQLQWDKIVVDLGAVTSSTGVIRFKATGTTNSGLDIGLDEVKVGNPDLMNIDAYYISDKSTGPGPLTVNFTDKSTGLPTWWKWDFNNDNVVDATTQNPSYVYNAPGVYSVKMISGKTGSSDTLTRSGSIFVSGYASLPFLETFESNWVNRDNIRDVPNQFWKAIPATGNNAWSTYNDGVLRGAWATLYGNYSPAGANGSNRSAVFNSRDTYNNSGNLDLSVNFSSLAGSKMLSFWHMNKAGTDKLEVFLSTDGGVTFGSALTTLNQNAVWTKVYVDLGNITTSTGVIRFKGSTIGSYDNTETNIGIDDVNIFVPALLPLNAEFKANVTAGTAPLTVNFSDFSEGAPTSWQWDFNNDGVVDATTQSPSYTYATSGIYSVKLTVGKSGTTDSEIKTRYIVVTGYAPIPFSEKFETPWISRDHYKDSPSEYVKNTPATGGNSWSRDDEGVLRGAWYDNNYSYSPAGAASSKRSARFHSGLTTGSGTLDFYLDFSTFTGEKQLSFWYINSSGSDKLEVSLSTDGGTTFGSVLSTLTTSTGWTRQSLNLGTSVATKCVLRFKATGDFGSTDIGIDEVKINAVEAAFTNNISTDAFPLTVSFTDKSTGSPDAWKWDFNADGTIDATTQNPVYTYANPGVYSVRLIASKTGSVDTITKTNLINVRNIQYSNLPFAENFEKAWVNFDHTRDRPSVNWVNTPASGNTSWSREDDGVLRGAWGSSSGSYSPSGANGSAHSARFHSYAAGSGTSGTLDLYVNFSSVSGEKLLNYWYINPDGTDKLEILVSTDGGATFGSVLQTSVAASSWTKKTLNLGALTASKGIIRFKATSDWGNSDIGLDEISIKTVEAAFNVNVTIGPKPLTVNFADNSIGSPTTWKWDFNNDGTIDATDQNPSFTYTEAGVYTAKLIAINAGSTDTIKKTNLIHVKNISYASLPFTETFENAWVNLDNTRDVPRLNWINSPATGANSWSREDDGMARGAWSNTWAGYTPTGANGSAHSARFHSYSTKSTGTLDLYVDFSTQAGNKVLYFWYFNESGTDKLEAFLSVDGGSTFSLLTTGETTKSWSKICINLGEISSTKGIVRFKATGDNNSNDIGIDDVYIGPASETPVAASFTSGEVNGIAPFKVDFADKSTGDVSNWKWDFNGDGIYDSFVQNPSYIYNTPGIYSVKLVAYKVNGKDSVVKTDYVTITSQIFAPVPYKESFENTWINRDATRDVPTLYFRNNPAVGNNSWSRSNDPGRTWASYYDISYSQLGADESMNSARFNSYGSSGLTGILDLFVDFSSQFGFQELSFWYLNVSGDDKLEVLLSKDGGVTFGSVLRTLNTSATWSQVKIDLGFVTASKGVVRFRATGDGRISDIGIDEVLICNPLETPVKGGFLADKRSGNAPLSVNFSDISSGAPETWKWDFNNDGIIDSDVQNPAYVFNNAGVYTVSLRAAKSSNSDSLKKVNYIVVPGYAKLPFTENFENAWVSREGIRDVPTFCFKNSPETGNNSWSRDDDGVLRNAWFSNYGAYSPSGANGSARSARFHSLWNIITGILDLQLDFSSLAGNKTLTFWYVNENGTDSLKVYLSTDGGTTDGTLVVAKGIEKQWTKVTVDLGAISSNTGVLRFKAKGDDGSTDIGIDEIQVGLTVTSAIDAKFTANVTKGFAPLNVKFTDQSTGEPASWSWDFDNDGKKDSESQSPSYVYTVPGLYSVSLTASTPGLSDRETKIQYIKVFDKVEADFISDKTEGSNPLIVGFFDRSNGNPAAWKWDLDGDGIFDATVKNPYFIYKNPGSYTVTLIASNEISSDTIVKTLYVKVDGKAKLPLVETFDDEWKSSRATRDVPSFFWRNGPPKASYSWSREDDGVTRGAWGTNDGVYTPAGANGSSHSARFHTYSFMNGYLSSFYLNVDFSSLAGSKTMSFYYINPGGTDKLEVFLSTDGGNTFGSALTTQTVSAAWSNVTVDLGNVTSANGIILFKVTADLDNSDIGIDEFSIQTTGVTPPVSQFTADKTNGIIPFTVKFTDQSTGSPTSWKWDFNNDGIIDSEVQNPSFTYKKAGTYTVRLYSNSPGAVDVQIKQNYITLEDTVVAKFDADQTFGNDSLVVKFTDKSTGNPTSWKWDFNNDGITDATTQHPEYKFKSPGRYSVKLVAYKNGSADSIVKVKYITVKKLVFANLPYNENFEKAWVNSDDVRDVPSYSWINRPSTGVNSWSREDDGVLRGAWSNLYGGSGSAAANGTLHSARFHSYNTYLEGNLDLHLDFSKTDGDKVLYFWYLNYDGKDVLNIQLSADSGKVFNTITTLGAKNTWTKIAIDLGKVSAPYGIIRFNAKGDNGVSDIKVDEVYVGPPSTVDIKPDFSVFSTLGYAPFKVRFTDKTTGDVTKWKWDLNGDGIFDSELQNPVYTYNAPGVYSVKLVASKVNMTDSIIKYDLIVIAQPLHAPLPLRESFDKLWVNSDSVRDVPSVYFRNNPASGNNSWSRNDDYGRAWTTYSYSNNFSGALNTRSSARFNSYGSSGISGILDVYVDFSTQAGDQELLFWYKNSSGTDKLEISLSNDGGVTFGNVIKTLTTEANWTRIVVSLGNQSDSRGIVRFKATGDGSSSDIEIDELLICNPSKTPLKADFTSESVSGESPVTIPFIDFTTGVPSSWEWDFNNDGTIDATTKNPTFTFTNPGTYNVKLKVKNDQWTDSVIKRKYILVPGYASLPFSEDFGLDWVSRNSNRDVPSHFFKNTPATGENSWSRDDDGVSRFAWSNNWGYDRGGNTGRFARFHSYSTGNGNLDLYVDFSTLTGEKTLTFLYYNYSGSDSLNVHLSVDNGTTFGPSLVTRKVSATWTKVTVDLGNVTSATGVIRFRAKGDGGSSDIGIDDISISSTTALPLTGKFTSNVQSGQAPLTVKFTDQTEGISISYKWDFNNDGVIDSELRYPEYVYTATGKYTVRQTVIGDGVSDTETKTEYINVYSLVKADFSTDINEGFAPMSVNFTNKSTGAPESWKWDFNGDGITDSQLQNPVFTYSQPGNYTVRLIASHPNSTDTIVKKASIKVKGKARLPYLESFDDQWVSMNDFREISSYNWVNSPAKASYSWSRSNDGVLRGAWSSNDGNYTPQGAENSLHSARFHSYDYKNGDANSFYLNVDFSSLAGPKSLSFYYINPGGGDKLEVFLSTDGGATYGPAIITQTTATTWTKVEADLGDVNSSKGVIMLKVTSGLDNTDIGIDELSVYSTGISPVTAQFEADKVLGVAPFTVNFTNQSTGGATVWRWDMNSDGVVEAATKNPTITYSNPGTYSVTLTAQKPGSVHSSTRTAYITVIEPVVSRFRADVTSGPAPLIVKFSDMSYGAPTSWEWDFNNDGVVDSTTQHPSFTFTQSGNYTVRLTVSRLGFTSVETKTSFIMVGPGTPVESTSKPEQQVLVYPSPTTLWTNIKLENFDGKRAKVEIIDIHGVVVANYIVSGNEALKIDCSVFARGLYYVKTTAADKVFTNTLILQ